MFTHYSDNNSVIEIDYSIFVYGIIYTEIK